MNCNVVKACINKLLNRSIVYFVIYMMIVPLWSQNEKITNKEMNQKINTTEEEWQGCLTPEEYRILREKGTEMAFTGKFNKHYEEGIYRCSGCGAKLFSSDTKYDSGSGWPSFWKPLSEGIVETKLDRIMVMERTEILCAKCGGHLGHLFEDGPNPTGLRYCLNSISLDFDLKEKKN